MSDKKIKLIVASTGGSGCGYLLRLFYHLLDVPGETHWMASDNFFTVMETEYGFNWLNLPAVELPEKIQNLYDRKDEKTSPEIRHKFIRYNYRDLSEPPSSGSVDYNAMIVAPCSMKTLGSIASGISSNLIERAADVSLKERRKLLLLVRETPYNLIHIENMKTLTLAGATIIPASPGFYHRPRSIDDLYDFMVDRLLSHAGITKRVINPWKTP